MILRKLCRSCGFVQIRSFSGGINHHERLELRRGASKKEIKAAYFKKAKQCHPDLYPDNPTKSEEFLQLQTSYNVLMSTECGPDTANDNNSADPGIYGTNFAQEIDREFLKSVWRDPIPRDRTGIQLNSSLLHPSSLAHYLNKYLNAVAGLGVALVGLFSIFKFFAWSFSSHENEEEVSRRERHEYYKNLNQSKARERRLPESAR